MLSETAMFSLVIAIVSIALLLVFVAVGGYFGGDAINDAKAKNQAARLISEERQIFAAMDMLQADHKRWPVSLDELVTSGYLRSIPSSQAAEEESSASLGWRLPLSSRPLIYTSHNVPKLTCRAYNLASRGDDGILRQPFETLLSQCYGMDGVYQVVARKPGVALTEALTVPVATGGLPSKDMAEWWDTVPSGDIKLPLDPAKVPKPELVLAGSSLQDFGPTPLGYPAQSEGLLTISNVGKVSATALTMEAPEDFGFINNTCTTELSPGASCSFYIGFSPKQAKTYAGSIMVAAGNGGLLQIEVRGVGFRKAQLELSQSGVEAFGDVLYRQSKRSAPRTVVNSGDIAVTALALSAPAGVSLVDSTCGSTLDAGASCSFALEFSPEAYQSVSGRVAVTSSNGDSVEFDVSGHGTTLFSDGGGTLLGSPPVQGAIISATPVAVDMSKRYKVRIRLRQVSGHGSIFVGVIPYDQVGSVIQSAYGGTYPYPAAEGVELTAGMGWQVFEGFLEGSYTPSTVESDRNKFLTGTKKASPMVLYNYYGTPGVVEVDYLELVDVATGAVLNGNSDMRSGIKEWTDRP